MHTLDILQGRARSAPYAFGIVHMRSDSSLASLQCPHPSCRPTVLGKQKGDFSVNKKQEMIEAGVWGTESPTSD
jgi:hypothetical protein